jgi:hypothetical protein
MKKRCGWMGLLAPLAALPMALGSQAGATTSWQTFGSASATGREPVAWPGEMVGSTTKAHPLVVRITFSDGAGSGLMEISWYVIGWDEETFRT